MKSGFRWKLETEEERGKVREFLLREGGVEERVTSPYEEWRIRVGDTLFILYTTGTLYSTPPPQGEFPFPPGMIERLTHPSWVPPTKRFLIGLDEAGKGEMFGFIHAVGVIIPSSLFSSLSPLFTSVDTKKNHSFSYWEEKFRELLSFTSRGFRFQERRLSPREIDSYRINNLLDLHYQKILSLYLRQVDMSETRVVVDDYGVGKLLEEYLCFLEKKGAEIIRVSRADDRYLEVRLASLIAKRNREKVMDSLNNSPSYRINGFSPGRGNSGDKESLRWLKKWYETHQSFPWFVRRSFSPVRRVEGRTGKPRKSVIRITPRLISEDFLYLFSRGRLELEKLGVRCPSCGEVSREIVLVLKKKLEGRCRRCGESISGLGETLGYYLGLILISPEVSQDERVIRDIEEEGFLKNFNLLVPKSSPTLKNLIFQKGLGLWEIEGEPVRTVSRLKAILLTASPELKETALKQGIFTLFLTQEYSGKIP